MSFDGLRVLASAQLSLYITLFCRVSGRESLTRVCASRDCVCS